MIKAHKIRLNPTSEQKTYFYRASGVARFAWNWALDEYRRLKAAGQEIDWNEIKIEFRARIKTEFPFVREVTKCAAEVAIADLRRAINTYYKTKGSNPKSKVRFPRRRKRSQKVGGFGLNNDKFSVSGHMVYVPKLEWIANAFTGRQVVRYGERQRPEHRLRGLLIDAQVADAISYPTNHVQPNPTGGSRWIVQSRPVRSTTGNNGWE